MHRNIFFLVFMAVSSLVLGQSGEFKLVSYNSLRYSPTNIDDRHPQLRMIMDELQPDILCIQELSGAGAAKMYMDSVLNSDSLTYSMATFKDENDLDIALYYKSDKFTFVSTHTYPTALRAIYHFQLIPPGVNDTLHIFGVHLKASSGSSNQQARKAEVDILRQVTDAFNGKKHFLICGDFNIYSSNESAYSRLLEDTPGDEGNFVDKLSLTGTFNNASYAIYHTQSPRSNAFNGGASGGMDDRFDMILVSEALDDTTSGLYYVPGSMMAFGNDGQHYNKSINDPPVNSAVGQEMADALYYASDHIPVVARFAYRSSNSFVREISLSQLKIAVSPEGFMVGNPENREISVAIYLSDGRLYRKFEAHSSQAFPLPQSGIFLVNIADTKGLEFITELITR